MRAVAACRAPAPAGGAAGGAQGAERLPGFGAFAVQRLGGEAALAAPLRGDLDARDAAAVALLLDLAKLQARGEGDLSIKVCSHACVMRYTCMMGGNKQQTEQIPVPVMYVGRSPAPPRSASERMKVGRSDPPGPTISRGGPSRQLGGC
jgi:hypothetical protein